MPSFNPAALGSLYASQAAWPVDPTLLNGGGDIGAGGPGAVHGNSAGTGATPGMTQQQMVWQNAAQEAAARRARIDARQQPGSMAGLPQNPYELAAWAAATGIGGRPAQGSALSAYQNYGGIEDDFNSASGPYAQWQNAVTAQAPSHAAVKIADIQAKAQLADSASKRDIARSLIDSLFGLTTATPVGGGGGMRTDYGAGYSMPRRPAPVDLRRFRPQAA